MTTCIIIDDELHNITLLKNYIARLDYLNVVCETTNPIDGLKYIQAHKPDLIFLDIQMEELSGITLAGMLNNKSNIIFTTASTDFRQDGFDLGVADYLLKPIKFDRFLQSVQRFMERTPHPSKLTEIFVKIENKGKMSKVVLDEVYYCQSWGNYTKIYTQNGLIMPLITLTELENTLPQSQFMRIHKSHIVALKHVMGIDGNELVLKTDKGTTTLAMGASYKERFLSTIKMVGKK